MIDDAGLGAVKRGEIVGVLGRDEAVLVVVVLRAEGDLPDAHADDGRATL